MELKRSWMMLAVILVVVLSEWKSSNACLDHERIALLKLRTIFDSHDYLLDWVESDHNSDCCQWQGVVCHNYTMNVIELHLSESKYYDLVPTEWYVNFTLFLPFEKLRTLDLSSNRIAGFVEDEGFERPSQLENLDLHVNNFNSSSILSSLSSLPSLKSLDLSVNNLQGALYLEDLNNFVSLKSLDLSDNKIEEFKSVKATVKQLTLSNLEALDLSGNLFDNSILRVLNGLTSLKSLKLGYNQLNGSIYIKDVLLILEELHLSGNAIKEFITLRGDKSYSKLKLLYLEEIDTDKNILLQSLGSTFPLLRTLHLGSNILNQTTSTLNNLTNLKELFLDGSTFDASLFQSMDALPSLKTLSFNNSELHGPLIVQGLPNFKKLEALDISRTTLSSSFLQTIGEMDALKVLRLAEPGFNGSLSLALGLCKLRFLEELDLSGNSFVGNLPACFCKFRHLRELDLSYNNFVGNMPACLSNFTFIQTLDLSGNQFTGNISESPLCKFRHLRELDLSYNNFVGNMPACLSNFTFIQTLDLSGNQFTGNISESPLTSLTSLQKLSLSDNHFQIPISLRPFYNHSKLRSFVGGNNVIYADDVPQSLAPKFQLNDISLSCCGDAGAVPQFLYHQHELTNVRLSHIHLKGKFPNWLLDNNPRLSNFYLANNSLSGPLDLPVHSHMYLSHLVVSHNLLDSKIPVEFGKYFPKLVTLCMDSNRFTGNIPSSFGYMSLLRILDLSNNSLQGQIFSEDFNLVNLEKLQLNRNQFTGKIPDSLSNSSSLYILDISNNHISGPIPKWMGNLSIIRDLRMASNHLKGPIPAEFCHLTNLDTLDLSDNDIFGSMQSLFVPSLLEVRLSNNNLSGTLDVIFSSSSSIYILDLSNNQLTGRIPHEIKRFPDLVFLFLSNNHLEGEVPIELCRLELLSWLDLSHNDLFGTIPKCLHVTMEGEAYNGPFYDSFSFAIDPEDYRIYQAEGVEFKTKWMSYLYNGETLKYMSGIDLSCNKFSGKIPLEIGNLSNILALNLSHNSLVGPIPKTFGNLKEIESMDLSNNFLSGNIPQELVALNFLAVFSVVSNNLSGEVPIAGQFGGFIESSYEGNPLLCGTQLRRNCRPEGSGSTTPSALVDHGDDDGFMDMAAFYASLTTTYLVAILGIVLVLVINPYWRQWWFYHIEKWTTTCYYFVVDNLPKRRQVAAMGRR